MNDCKIEQSDGRCLGWQHCLNNFSPIPMEIPFPTWTIFVTARYLQSIKTFLTVELSQYSKSGSTFSSSEPVVASRDCSRLGYSLCLCLPVRPAQTVLEHCPKSLAIDFAVKTFDCLLEQPSGVIARWPAGARTWTQTWTLPPDQWVVVVLSAPKPQNKVQ